MKNILITGANGHLGSAVTQSFLDNGYQVIAVVPKEAKDKWMERAHLDVVSADLTDEGSANACIVSAISKYKQIDAALLLVGGFAAGNILSTSGEDIAKQIQLNFNTAYFIARPLFRHFQERNAGRIVFIGARPGLDPDFGKDLVAYGLSKSLLFRLAEYINAESAGKNIIATVIAPSTLDTPVNRKSMPDADPGTWVKPSDLAEIMQFIVSDKSVAIRETVLKVYNNS